LNSKIGGKFGEKGFRGKTGEITPILIFGGILGFFFFLQSMYQEINDLMDSILDANGNKISEFKDYLTPEHYRLIRSGIDVKEIKDPDVLLASLRKMKPKSK